MRLMANQTFQQKNTSDFEVTEIETLPNIMRKKKSHKKKAACQRIVGKVLVADYA